jgi:hypothetical protein
MPLMVSGVECVQWPDGDTWLIQCRDIDHCASGKTKAQALVAFTAGFSADILGHADPRFAWPKACPADVWADLTGRDGAERLRMAFTRVAALQEEPL